MKRYASILMTVALVSGLLIQPSVSAEGTGDPVAEENQNGNFLKVTGEVNSIKNEPKGNNYATVKAGEREFGFYYNESTMVLNNAGEKVELTEGTEITAFVDSRKSMIMIYPPRYSPEVIIVHSKHPGTVELQRFNEQLLNEKGDLVIHVTDETEIHDLSGRDVPKEALVEKDVLIFYEYVLESYPAQTGPYKIVVLEKETTNIEKAADIANKDYYKVNSVKMIPLRLVAEQLGFTVESYGKVSVISKGSVSFTITLGAKHYGYNKSIRYFKEEPELLEKSKTYVPYELLEQLIELTKEE
ncbi:stalk domain-containing protein [Ureibacillus aquaedulcis]|uniref:Stalk domain-containing protein n=1 Tax=Ureibacillus aquaedulcis TaxID=3058421 RepID=A0ABT8GQW6_9BACL|nr:stalk domain-containing protein [Ureibacillus sp. BA0131]MDN4493805.1 stalk domain-containing protein [Ureibacillus sp. BA0131]